METLLYSIWQKIAELLKIVMKKFHNQVENGKIKGEKL